MVKQPNTRRNLDVAIERAFGSGERFIQTRILIANTILSTSRKPGLFA
jgi:hypothetical protein